MNQSDIYRADFSSFPSDETFAQIPGKLFLTDNLDVADIDSSPRSRSAGKIVQVKMMLFFTCLAGELNIDVNHRPLTVSAGQIALILPDSFFRYISHSSNARIIFMAVSTDFIDYAKDVRLGIEFGQLVVSKTIFNVPPLELEDFLSLYNILKRKLYEPSYTFKEEVARNVLSIIEYNVMNEFLRHKEKTPAVHPLTRKEELFRHFIDEVKQHFLTERSVTYYARQLCVTPKYLSTAIHEATGRYATDFITSFVINECKALLHTEGLSIKEVSSRMNFPNQSFFAKYFRKHTGMTPREYKQQTRP